MSRVTDRRTGPRSESYGSVVDSLVSALAEVVRCRDHESAAGVRLVRTDVERRLTNVGLLLEDAKGVVARLRREVE